MVIVHAVHESGRREIIGLDVGAVETEAFWREFLRGLVARGLVGVQLAISDAHPGSRRRWRRCSARRGSAAPQFLRDPRPCPQGPARRPWGHRSLDLRRRNGEQARERLREAVEQLERRLPKIGAMLEEAEADVLAFYAFSAEHRPKLKSTNPLERFNREIARRTDVVGIFPDDASLIRLVSMLAIEANDCHEGRPGRFGGLSSARRRLGACQSNGSDARRQTCSISASTGGSGAPRGAR